MPIENQLLILFTIKTNTLKRRLSHGFREVELLPLPEQSLPKRFLKKTDLSIYFHLPQPSLLLKLDSIDVLIFHYPQEQKLLRGVNGNDDEIVISSG